MTVLQPSDNQFLRTVKKLGANSWSLFQVKNIHIKNSLSSVPYCSFVVRSVSGVLRPCFLPMSCCCCCPRGLALRSLYCFVFGLLYGWYWLPDEFVVCPEEPYLEIKNTNNHMCVCRNHHLTLMFSGLLRKDLFKGRWSLAKRFFKQNFVTHVTQGLPSSFLSRPVT